MTPLMVAAGLGFEWQFTNHRSRPAFGAVKYLVEELRQDLNAKDEQRLHRAPRQPLM